MLQIREEASLIKGRIIMRGKLVKLGRAQACRLHPYYDEIEH